SSFAVTVSVLPTVPATPAGPAQVDIATTPGSNYSTSAGNASYGWHLAPPTAGTIAGTSETAVVTWSSSFTGNAEISVKGQNACGESAWSTVKTTQVINTTGINEDAASIQVITKDGSVSLVMNTNTEQARVKLLDLSGRILLNTTIPGQGTQLISQDLKPGIYFLVIDAGNTSLKKKILVN
ncbi:MAG: T9SS type A sorting domain-containing protein, partial [Bacteroidota bacterium]